MEPIGSCKDCGLEYTANMASWRGIEHSKDACIKRMHDQLAAARAEVAEAKAVAIELRRQIANQQANNVTRNRELDALHYVWCDGGCAGGVHRWQESPPTEEIVTLAIRNTRRLAHWWDGHIMRAHPELTKARYQSHLEIEETVRDLQSQLDAARERERELVVRCRKCKGTALYKRISPNEVEFYEHHDCIASEPAWMVSIMTALCSTRLREECNGVGLGYRPEDFDPEASMRGFVLMARKMMAYRHHAAIAAAHPEPGADGDGADRGKS